MAGFEVGAEGEGGEAEGGAGEAFGGAEGFHAGEGDPGAFLPGLGAVEHADVVDAHEAEGGGGGEAAHAGADDGDVGDGGAVMGLAGDPWFGGEFQPGEVLLKAGLQGREAGCGCGEVHGAL